MVFRQLVSKRHYFRKSEISQAKIRKIGNLSPYCRMAARRGENQSGPQPGSFILPARAMGSGRFARPSRRLGPQPLDLAPRQRDADLADPLKPYPVNRLGVEARQVDQRR